MPKKTKRAAAYEELRDETFRIISDPGIPKADKTKAMARLAAAYDSLGPEDHAVIDPMNRK